MNKDKRKSMLEKLYQCKQYELEEQIRKQEKQELKNVVNDVKIEEIEEMIKNNNEVKNVIEEIKKLVEDYEMKISFYSEKYYKEGVKDGFHLCNECIKEL